MSKPSTHYLSTDTRSHWSQLPAAQEWPAGGLEAVKPTTCQAPLLPTIPAPGYQGEPSWAELTSNAYPTWKAARRARNELLGACRCG